jgi:hypothetical protein
MVGFFFGQNVNIILIHYIFNTISITNTTVRENRLDRLAFFHGQSKIGLILMEKSAVKF